jgi:hypothetical protein
MLANFFSDQYWIARLIFQKSLALLYIVAFLVALNQFKALLGENGLLPVPRFLTYVKFSQAPSIFHFYYSDKFFMTITWLGLAVSIFLFFGFADKFSFLLNAFFWFIPWLIYLSIVNVGQTFYSFGWESLLLEIGFLSIFLGSNKSLVPIIIIFLLRLILFKLEFGAGLIKIRGDECWRNLTCLNYHHETQPMPNPLSWYFHNLPNSVHKLEVLGNHFVQLIVPWGLFLPQPFSSIAATMIVGTQFWLVLSGNFSWLNWSAIILSFSAFSNSYLKRIFPFIEVPTSLTICSWQQNISIVISILILVLSYKPILNLFSKQQKMNASFDSLHLVNTYGAFGSVTKQRYEIIIEGSLDKEINANTKWLEYEFKGKPGDLAKMPAQYAPYHLRLDWLMWFASFGFRQQQHWFMPLIEKLLQNDRETLKLLRTNPFDGQAPVYIRARGYIYEFTNYQERKNTGNYWKRKLIGEYLEPVKLR